MFAGIYTRSWQLIKLIYRYVYDTFNDPCLQTPKPMHTTKLILEGDYIHINI